MRGMSAFALAISLATCAPPQQANPADLVIVTSRIFTASGERPWAHAVAVDYGRIVAVGTNARLSGLA